MEAYTKLYMLLEASHRLVGHPRLKRLAAWVNAELGRMDAATEPVAVPEERVPAPAPVYPRKSGVVETNTDSVPTVSDRRA